MRRKRDVKHMARSDKGPIYVVDSSSWISIEGHPAREGILYAVLGLIEQGKLACPPEVWDELKKCDWVLAWIGEQRKRVVRSLMDPEYLAAVGHAALAYPSMCATRGSKEKADGYVVAMVVRGNRTANPQQWIGVAEDQAIRAACSEYQAEGIDLFEMLRREYPDEGW